MDTSEAKRNIYQKLSYIQLNLKAPKNQYNKFGAITIETVRIYRKP